MSPHTKTNKVVVGAKLIQRNSRATVDSYRGAYLTQTGPVIVLPQEFGIGVRDSSLVLLLFEKEKMWTRGLVAVVFPVYTHEYHKQVSSQRDRRKQMDEETMTKNRQRMLVVCGRGSSCFWDPPTFQSLGSGKHMIFFLIIKFPFSFGCFDFGPCCLQRKDPRIFCLIIAMNSEKLHLTLYNLYISWR